MSVVSINGTNAERLQTGIVIVDFYATWCGPCKKLATVFADRAASYPNVLFAKVDVDENEILQDKYDVSSLPTVKLLKNGNVVEQFSGFDVKKLDEMIRNAS